MVFLEPREEVLATIGMQVNLGRIVWTDLYPGHVEPLVIGGLAVDLVGLHLLLPLVPLVRPPYLPAQRMVDQGHEGDVDAGDIRPGEYEAEHIGDFVLNGFLVLLG